MSSHVELPLELSSVHAHLTGIKGTGMAALAEVLVRAGARVTGSDVAERFYTDTLLERIGIEPEVGFEAGHVPPDATIVVHSAAYTDQNPEIREAHRRGLPVGTYNDVLGELSRRWPTVAIAGVHGKTTTTAMAGTILQRTDVPVTVLVGSAVPTFGGAATLSQGGSQKDRFFVVEACEYRRHFLTLDPSIALITSVELDHTDYFSSAEDTAEAFRAFGRSLSEGGTLIYCADDPGAKAVAMDVQRSRSDIQLIPYGHQATGPYCIGSITVKNGRQVFRVGRDKNPWNLHIPGEHMVLDAVGAIAVVKEIAARAENVVDVDVLREGLKAYRGSRRRSETVAEINGITVIDDYGHHPTAIRKTLAGYRAFYPERRIVVDFMSHTFSRSATLLDDFAISFRNADVVIVNRIYGSAREAAGGQIDSEQFARAISRNHPSVWFEPEFEEAASRALSILEEGDIFITMGAGDNFRVGELVIEALKEAG